MKTLWDATSVHNVECAKGVRIEGAAGGSAELFRKEKRGQAFYGNQEEPLVQIKF